MSYIVVDSSCSMYWSMKFFEQQFKVVKTKSVKFMPLSLSLAGFFNGIIWSAYAFIRFDPYILVLNESQFA